MSRIGVVPVQIPAGVEIDIAKNTMSVKGAKGQLEVPLFSHIKVTQDEGAIKFERTDDSQTAREQHGLARTLVSNAVTGVSEGFSKTLIVEGVGFKVAVSGNKVTLNLGYSHPSEISLPEGISAANENNKLTISGIDKQMVGQVAANIRELRKPEPYKGKGIRYEGERIIRKAGKAAGAGK